MAINLDDHPCFEKWTEPTSGVDSYLLTRRVAPIQKGFYYTTPGMSADGKWLWFYAAFPPSSKWSLAAVSMDPADPQMHHFPRCQLAGNPRVLPEGDAVIVPINDGLYRQEIGQDAPEEVLRLPKDFTGGRHLHTLLTTVTFSADGKYVVMDLRIGNRWLIALAELATGEVHPLRWFDRCHHHAMFSPTDPELIMIGQGPWTDLVTGDKGNMNIRMWLMDTKLTRYEPVLPDLWFGHNCMSCHEWWAPDGTIYWCDYEDGIYHVDPAKDFHERRKELIWSHPLCHADCDRSQRYFMGDENPYHRNERKPCGVFFYDSETGREVTIASDLPFPTTLPMRDFRRYHLDPHGHFSPDGEYIIYTTTARDLPDVAITPVEPLKEQTS